MLALVGIEPDRRRTYTPYASVLDRSIRGRGHPEDLWHSDCSSS